MAKHYCTEHQTVFFKKGKMRGYAHPIEDSEGATGETEWCNEDAQEVAKLPSQPHDKVLPEHQEVIDKARASVRAPRSTNDDTKLKTFAISYAKDLVVASKIDITEIAEYAEMFYRYMAGTLTVDEARLLNLIMEVKSEAVKTDSKTKTSTEVSEDEGTQEVLDSGEQLLTLTVVKQLLLRNKKDLNEWARDIAQRFHFDMNGKTVRQLWEVLDDNQKGLAIGGLK